MNRDLTKGSVLKSMLLFSIPMILGDLLQQCYNIVDTLIVGQFLGKNALASVGSSFTLMTFITSIILGLCEVERCFQLDMDKKMKKDYGKMYVHHFSLLHSSRLY